MTDERKTDEVEKKDPLAELGEALERVTHSSQLKSVVAGVLRYLQREAAGKGQGKSLVRGDRELNKLAPAEQEQGDDEGRDPRTEGEQRAAVQPGVERGASTPVKKTAAPKKAAEQ